MKVLVLLVVCASMYAKVEGITGQFVTACHSSDAKCHRASAQKAVPMLAAGVPSLGLTPLDPLQLRLVKADQAGLKVEFRNTIVKGLRHCTVLGLNRHGHKVTLELNCSPTLIGDYVIGGKLLVLPVEGDGKYKIKIRDIVVKVEYEIGERMSGGVRYWTMSSWQFTSEVRSGAEFQFQNLFNGNKQLSDSVHQFANANWRDIFQEVAPPVVKAIVSRIVEEVRKFFDKVPASELSLD